MRRGDCPSSTSKSCPESFKKRPLWCLREHFWDQEPNLVPLRVAPLNQMVILKKTFSRSPGVFDCPCVAVWTTTHHYFMFHCWWGYVFAAVAFRPLCPKALQHVDDTCTDLINNIGLCGTLGMPTALAGDAEEITRKRAATGETCSANVLHLGRG